MIADAAVVRYLLALAVRSRLIGLLTGTGGAAVAAAWILTELTPGTERRTFFDAAYLGLEWLAVLSPVLISTMLQVQEFDQRTLWLVLVRPVGRMRYARARVFGLAGAAWLALLAVGALLGILATALGALPEPWLLPVLCAAALEALVLASLACLWTFATTSYLTALLVQVGTVLVGYWSPLLPALAQRAEVVPVKVAIWAVYWVSPHLGNFAVREFTAPPEDWYLAWLAGYAACYAAGVTIVAALVAARREP